MDFSCGESREKSEMEDEVGTSYLLENPPYSTLSPVTYVSVVVPILHKNLSLAESVCTVHRVRFFYTCNSCPVLSSSSV